MRGYRAVVGRLRLLTARPVAHSKGPSEPFSTRTRDVRPAVEEHHDVEVRHRRAAARQDAASQERSTDVRVVFLYNGTRGVNRIHAVTIQHSAYRAHGVSSGSGRYVP
ncbi:hypothetical protein Sfulv_27630 [Streptomyces fulvorobeus]|uniref:Uncharacterized protein n=1 Tax=Streptomyces fulvorobeus TaxID=284028 RepID=A0A7J0C629_9ACTN|nr:hypothetical protein Sfulv_27630 [Streptomyces fulvorobeus]